nr:atherin-like [Aegilops tauschii subsp. strangulata]
MSAALSCRPRDNRQPPRAAAGPRGPRPARLSPCRARVPAPLSSLAPRPAGAASAARRCSAPPPTPVPAAAVGRGPAPPRSRRPRPRRRARAPRSSRPLAHAAGLLLHSGHRCPHTPAARVEP